MKVKLTQKNFLPISIGVILFLSMIWSLYYGVYMFFAVLGGYITVMGIIIVLININNNLPEK